MGYGRVIIIVILVPKNDIGGRYPDDPILISCPIVTKCHLSIMGETAAKLDNHAVFRVGFITWILSKGRYGYIHSPSWVVAG